MSLLFKEWLPAQEENALRVKDVKKMKKGDEMELAIFDRNIGDIIDNAIREKKIKLNRAYSIETLLKRLDQIATYKHEQDISGTYKFKGGESPFTFDVLDNKKKMWKSPKTPADLKNNRILGYRGYAIPMTHINKKEKVKIQINRLEPLETYL